ncbi:MAG: hypothetical protein ACRDJU_01810 [Actinomycetota bacterium]
MSLHGGGGGGPSGGKEKKSKSGGGFKSTGRGGASSGGPAFTPPSRPAGGGASYSPGSGSPSEPSQPSGGGGFKMPGLGGGGGHGGLDTIWGGEPTQPGLTSSWSEGTKLGVAVIAGLLILGALVALVVGLASGGGKPGPAPTSAQGGVVSPFNPPTQAGATETDLPIVFTDGTTADLLYDQSLNLNSLPGGVQLSDSGAFGSAPRGSDEFQIDHGGASFVQTESPATPPKTVPGVNNSPVPILSATTNNQGKNVNGNWLDFHFGDWRVGVWEGVGTQPPDPLMSSSDEQGWAANLNGSVTSSGWLTLTGTNGLDMTPFGQPNGPQIQFGNISPNGVILTPENCTAPLGTGVQQNSAGVPYRLTHLEGAAYEGFLCQQGVGMTFDIYGDSQFVSSAANSLEITNLKKAAARPNASGTPAPSPSS